MLRRPQTASRACGLGLWNWPAHFRLVSIPIVALLTSHTIALVLELNLVLDALLTVASLGLMLLLGDRSSTGEERGKPRLSLLAKIAIVAVAIATLLNATIPSIARLAVLAAFYLLTPLAVARFRQTSILAGIVVYAIVECVLVLSNLSEFNPNAAAQRVIVAICVLGFCLRPRWARYVALAFATALAFGFESRTALGAAWIAFFYIELAKSESFRFTARQPIVCLILLGVVLTGFRALAMEFLVHESPDVVQDFFWDKQDRDLADDPFDRKEMWAIGMRAIQARPWVGVGLGNEQVATGDLRAHNAYMKLAIESGVPAAMVVILFFCAMLHRSFRSLLRAKSDTLTHITCFCLIYLLVSACFESSGLFSIGTPTNLIAYLGFCFIFNRSSAPNDDKNSRR